MIDTNSAFHEQVAIAGNSPIAELLRIDGLTLRRGKASVLDEVSLTLAEGRTLGLVGESGAGKSTLAMALIGLLMAKSQNHYDAI